MRFKSQTIAPAGRNKYGTYVSSKNITRQVTTTVYNGDGTTNDLGGNSSINLSKYKNPPTAGSDDYWYIGGVNTNIPVTHDENNKQFFEIRNGTWWICDANGKIDTGIKVIYNDDSEEINANWLLFLSKVSNNFDGMAVSVESETDITKPIAYRGQTITETFVGDLTKTEDDTSTHHISGITEGMEVLVTNNGTKETQILITLNKGIEEKSGTLIIPCYAYVGNDGIRADFEDWYDNENKCIFMALEYNWTVINNATSTFVLDLDNEAAQINCDKDGNILAGAVLPICKASLFYGTEKVESGVTYSISYNASQSVQGVSINDSTGLLIFGSDFSFVGTALEVKVSASRDGKVVATKKMSISKSYPGADGVAAVTRWIVLNADAVKYNPNNNTTTPSSITAKVMKQEGENAPVEDSSTPIFYGYNTDSPSTRYTTAISPDVSKDYISFGLKNASNVIYETETVPILKDGTNGTNGINGTSPYRLDLSNENASINADKDGNILAGAVRPTCTATLYYGASKATNVTYSKSTTATGVSINDSTGVLDFASNFNFTGTAVEITVTAKISNVIYGTAIMTVSKSIAGQNGTNGTNGKDGKDGIDGKDGTNGIDGINGEDGVSIVWVGTYTSHPSNPQNGWAYYNSRDKKSYVYQDGAWYTMSIDGVDGTNGTDGLSIVWKGDSSTPPSNPQKNWCYRDTDNGVIYIYNGTSWEMMTKDGDDGTNGTNGTDGKSVFICYNDNAIDNKPAKPTGDGTIGGWHTTPSTACTWMSQKVSTAANVGAWGDPILIKGKDGKDGTNGTNGTNGEDGDDAVSYWLVLSADELKVDKNNTVSPETISATAMKQVGENAPTTASECTIKYGFDTAAPSTTYSSAINVSSRYNNSYITFQLLKGSTVVDTETVVILKDGKDGKDGEKGNDGQKGAAVRGPVNWYDQNVVRRFCNGVLTNASYPQDALYIDIIIKDDHYYYCNTSYTGSARDSWSSVSSYWTQADQEFGFIATKLLLANNAKIDFLASNEILLYNDAGTQVVAGAKGGSNTNFFAGAAEATNAPFRVNYDGSIYASKGTFAGYVRMPYTFIADLVPNQQLYNATIGTYQLVNCDYRGKLSAAPTTNLKNSTTYYNTSNNTWYTRYGSSWYTMTDRGANGYIADDRAYLIADSRSGHYGMGLGGVLVLPEPSEALNGFTYHIIVEPNFTTKTEGQNPGIALITPNESKVLQVYAFSFIKETCKALAFYGGHIEITCIPKYSSDGLEYRWVLTQATGGVDLYPEGLNGNVLSVSPVASYVNNPDYSIFKIKPCKALPQFTDLDTLYVVNPDYPLQ